MKTPIEQVDELIEYVGKEEETWMAMRDGCEKYSDDYNHDQRMFATYFRIRCILEDRKREIEKRKVVPIGFG